MNVVVAEKPSVARELAAFLGARTRREGYIEGGGYRVTWALGHLATLKEPHDYDPAWKRWSLASLPIVPERFEIKPIDDARSRAQLGIVLRLIRGANAIICATDAGREGELIFRYILELSGCEATPTRRLWLSSLTEAAIREGFRRLRPLSDYDHLDAAARCRSMADWVVGLNATRYYTVRYRSGGQLWSVGRVQTPVLALIVGRDDAIRTFRPESFWELLTRYREVVFKFAGDRFAREEEAREFLRRVEGQPFTIKGVERKPERVRPPQLHDLTDLQREMNRRFGMSADATLKAAQSLYEAKLITYPRTDSRHLGSDLKTKIPEILRALRPLRPAEIDRLDLPSLPFSRRIVDDSKVGDHHAIIPTGKTPSGLSPATGKIFDAIVVRLIAAFSPDCLKEVTIVDGESAGVLFRARGVRVVEPGWTVLEPRRHDEPKEDEQDLPAFHPGEVGPHEPTVREGRTTPPKPYTEASLLGAIETAGRLVDDEQLKEALKEKGLGTPATRASIIETLLDRGYIRREGRVLAATDLGRYLVALVRDRGLKSPELTGEWEAKLREVERGRLDPARFRAEIVRYTASIVGSADAVVTDPDRLGECPRCGRPVIEGRRGLGCSGWREGCPFVLWREYKGNPLDEPAIRELLQHRVLLRPMAIQGVGEVILQLADSGDLLEIPVPTGGPPRPMGKPQRRTTGRRSGASTPKRDSTAGASGSRSGRSKEATFATVALGKCPRCGSEVVEQAKSFGCRAWKEGCKFAIWKTIAGKRIGVRAAQTLLREGRTPILKGFASKAGARFEARLTLDGGEVRLDFDR